MRNLLGLCTLLLAPATLPAQTPANGSVLLLQQPASQNCPVNLSASRLPDGGMARVTSGPRPKGEPFHLTFRPTDEQGITQADIIFHGMSGSHVVPAGTEAAPSTNPDTTETFSVSPAGGANHLFNSVVYTRKLTAVNYVELQSITFADGAQWHASANSICRVAPNGYHLVASGK